MGQTESKEEKALHRHEDNTVMRVLVRCFPEVYEFSWSQFWICNFCCTIHLCFACSVWWCAGSDSTQLMMVSSKCSQLLSCTATVFQTENSSLLKKALLWSLGGTDHNFAVRVYQRLHGASLSTVDTFIDIVFTGSHRLCVVGQFLPQSGRPLGSATFASGRIIGHQIEPTL